MSNDLKDAKVDFSKNMYEDTLKVIPDVESSILIPRVFIFQADVSLEEITILQKNLREQINQGCLVLNSDIKFIGIEDLYKKEKQNKI